jgi:hypothetical protein
MITCRCKLFFAEPTTSPRQLFGPHIITTTTTTTTTTTSSVAPIKSGDLLPRRVRLGKLKKQRVTGVV